MGKKKKLNNSKKKKKKFSGVKKSSSLAAQIIKGSKSNIVFSSYEVTFEAIEDTSVPEEVLNEMACSYDNMHETP